MKRYGDYLVERLVIPPLGENTYILWDGETKEGYVIDPGGLVDEIEAIIRREKIKILKIIATHGHYDHLMGVAELKTKLKVPFVMNKEGEAFCNVLKSFAPMFGKREDEIETPTIDEDIKEGDSLPLGNNKIKVLFTPGHAPGHICLYLPPIIFVGDVLFRGSVGRTDFPGGSTETLIKNITNKLLILPDDTIVLSGHGPETTIGIEKKTNPFLTGQARLK